MAQTPVLIALALALLPALSLDRCSGGDPGLALGMTARERVALTATASEIITALPVREGTTVTRGTVLVQFDDAIERAEVDLARANVAQSEANLAKLTAGARAEEIAAAEADVTGARARLRAASLTYERNRALVRSDAVTQARLDTDLADRDAAQAVLTRAEEVLKELRNGTRPEDLAMARAELEANRARLTAAERKLEDLTIRASRDGILDSLPWNLGERVSAGSPVAVLLGVDRLTVRAYVPEPYRARLNAGDRLTVRVDGVGQAYEGVLRWISSDPAFTPYYALNQSERSRLMYLAEITLPPEANALPVGIPAQVVLP